MEHLDLNDDEAAALISELADITGSDRYPLSPRIRTLRAILAKLRPEPVPQPAPPSKGSDFACLPVASVQDRPAISRRGAHWLGRLEAAQARSVTATANPILYALDALDRAEEFFEAFRQLPASAGWRISWPRYFLLCHAVEIGLKAFLASRGVPIKKLQKDFGHKIDPLMRAALDERLKIGVLAATEIMQLDEAHARHWPRYPRQEIKPVFVIEFFEPYVRELLLAISTSIRRNAPSAPVAMGSPDPS
jgi:hypothetical protein